MFFVPMSTVEIVAKGGVALGSVSVEAVASHCRGKREETEEGGQQSAAALRYEPRTHTHAFTRLD